MPPYVSEGVVERVDMGDLAGLAGALDRLLRDSAARAALVERARDLRGALRPSRGRIARPAAPRRGEESAEVRHARGRPVSAPPAFERRGPGHRRRARPVFIVAEAGVNHNGDLELARRLVDAAADASADAVKFQTFRTEPW